MILATDADAEDISALEYELFPDNSISDVTVRTELDDGYCVIARNVEGRLLGYCLVRCDEQLCDILRLGVSESSRGEGIASKLLTDAFAVNAHSAFMLTVDASNAVATCLYESHGFCITRHLTGSDNWIMERPATYA